MNAVSLLRLEFGAAHDFLEATMRDVTSEQAHWLPPGIANPIGATYAHIILSEDFTINGMLQGGTPLAVSTWAGKAGLSEPPPATPFAWGEWGRRVHVDLGPMHNYARAVYASSDAYLASLTDDDLDREVDFSAMGIGQIPLATVLGSILLGNVWDHCGEISTLKGLQGQKGYPV